MNKTVQALLNVISYGGIDVEATRRIADLKKLDPLRIFLKKLDTEVYNRDHKVPVRLYFADENAMEAGTENVPVVLFFHGGGWTTESVETYDRVCSRMAQSIGHLVVSVEYRLAPEYRFPFGFEDCYAAAAALFGGQILPGIRPEQITVMGDSAGGNLAAAVCIKARDTGDFTPRRQILIYPALNNCYTEESPYESVHTNGTGYLLTSQKMADYQDLYESKPEDRVNPYFAPLCAEDYSHLPDTLILTAEFDPLRDEGEEYGRRMRNAGGRVHIQRIKGALHGYFALGIQHLHVQESFRHINHFLKMEQDMSDHSGYIEGERGGVKSGGETAEPLEKT